MSDKQILQILRLLKKHPDEGHYYCDYMNACAQLGEYPYGITPKISLKEAHDRTVARIDNYHDVITRKAFEAAVKNDEYTKLATCLTKEDEVIFEKDEYIISVPDTSDDLFLESESMHNCVRIYIPNVAKRLSRIYFLRQRANPLRSFGTIELSGDGRRLLQAKAFANAKLDVDAQKFILKWCKYNDIQIDTSDILVG